MASALEPLLSGCIFSLVVVSDSKDFWHVLLGNSTRNSGESNMGGRGYHAALELSSRNPNWTSSSGFLGTARGRGKGVRRDGREGGQWGVAGWRGSRGLLRSSGLVSTAPQAVRGRAADGGRKSRGGDCV